MSDDLLRALEDWLRIPSVSTGEGNARDLLAAARWACERVRAAGGVAELVEMRAGANPLVVGTLPASEPDAPTVLIYGHYDVQGPGPLQLWESPPFVPQIRDGRLYARGASDDKGNFLPLLHVACAMCASGSLPVNVRVLVEGEEEIGSESAMRWLADDAIGADAAIVFDSAMADADTPAVTVGLRGLVQMHLRARTAAGNLHSGVYGGSVLNAAHVLMRCLERVLPDERGRLRGELRAGIVEPSDAELRSWERLPPGDEVLAQIGAAPVHAGAGAEYYLRNGADASLDVNAISAGEPRTIVPPQAQATLTMRLAPRQDPLEIAAVLRRLLEEAVPDGATLEIEETHAAPALFRPDEPALKLAGDALRRGCDTEPAFLRSGGSIPVVAGMAARGYPVIVSGFALGEDSIHAPNESFSLRSLRMGEAAARELLLALAGLPRG